MDNSTSSSRLTEWWASRWRRNVVTSLTRLFLSLQELVSFENLNNWSTYGQSLQLQYFFIFPLKVFTTGGWKKWSMSRRFSSRDGASSSIGWTLTSTRSPSLSTSFGFPSDVRVCISMTAFNFRIITILLNIIHTGGRHFFIHFILAVLWVIGIADDCMLPLRSGTKCGSLFFGCGTG